MENVKDIKKISLIKPRYIIIIAAVMTVVLVFSSYYEFSENKKELYHLLNENAASLINIISSSSYNSILSETEYERLLSVKLLGVAKNISRLETLTKITDEMLQKIAEENEVFRINIFDKSGRKIYSNFLGDGHREMTGRYSPKDMLEPLLEGRQNELVMGLKEARMEKGTRFAVAVKRQVNEGGAIVVNMNADFFIEFRKKTGVEKLINELGKYSGIEYIVLQDTSGVMYSNKNFSSDENIMNDSFLNNAYNTDNSLTRIYEYQSKKVFEIVKSFSPDNQKMGIFRIALSVDEISRLENRMITRTVIISFILLTIIIIVVSVIISNQNYKIISDKYSQIKTLSGGILANMNQGVITVNNQSNIEVFNESAKNIFGMKEDITGKNIKEIVGFNNNIINLLKEKKKVSNFELQLNDKTYLINSGIDEKPKADFDFFTIVITDVTEQRRLQQSRLQDEKLLAMGELASAVAHEVRNPLNSINMISQRFEKEYQNRINSDEFKSLVGIMKSESARVNTIVEQFLKYARPPKIQKVMTDSGKFLNDTETLFKVKIKSENVIFELIKNCSKNILIDAALIKQALINLLNNSLDSLDGKGKITLEFGCDNENIFFEITDNGQGIEAENLNKVYNLYYTTKQNGTGLGLSIVRQIVQGHNGTMTIESIKGEGTKVKIILPQ